MSGLAGLGLKAVEGGVEDRNKHWVSSMTEGLFIMCCQLLINISPHSN